LAIKDFFELLKALKAWRRRAYAAPSPNTIKRSVLERNGIPGATWVETGTFKGNTTAFLAGIGGAVYSIEPEPTLFANAERRFAGDDRITILNGPSEKIFPDLLPTLSGDINFWLDGHYSAGVTFKGDIDTPIIAELDEISRNLDRFGRMTVLIDDLRCFDPDIPEYAEYPSLDYLVDWARENGFKWSIEHDIFIARR